MESHTGITIVGLGPGSPELLTIEAWEILNNAPIIYLRTKEHPTVDGLPEGVEIKSFDHLYEQDLEFEQVYEQIIESVLESGRKGSGVVYGVPGHPLIAEATSPEIIRQAKIENIPIRVIEGLSFLEVTFGALGIDPFPQTSLVDGLELAMLHQPPFPPSAPALIAQIYSAAVASEVKLTLMNTYPDHHPVNLVHSAGTEQVEVENLQLYEIDRSKQLDLRSVLYVPALENTSGFENFQEIVARLRAPDGCPWDREQTHLSLRPYLLEETYEVLEALDNEDQAALKEELGDLMLQIVLHAQIASEYGDFTMVEVLNMIQKKLIHRHPHVFADLEVKDQKTVVENWQKIKLAEHNGEQELNGVLRGVSLALPALVQAQTFQERVNRVGFDWPDIQGVFEKIREEIQEVGKAETQAQFEEEIGDLLFSVVNLARWKEVDAESALRSANVKFRQRFEQVEAMAKEAGQELVDLNLDVMDQLWEQVKGENSLD